MNSGFRILEHPSDLGIEAWGPDLAEMFRQSALALTSVIVDPTSLDAVEQRVLNIQGSDTENLLVRWLSEILYLYDGEDFLLAEVGIQNLDAYSIRAVLLGERVNATRHRFRTDVKAVTYHQLKVVAEPGNWLATVFLDI
jgi:SHS2 domain-containing protein